MGAQWAKTWSLESARKVLGNADKLARQEVLGRGDQGPRSDLFYPQSVLASH